MTERDLLPTYQMVPSNKNKSTRTEEDDFEECSESMEQALLFETDGIDSDSDADADPKERKTNESKASCQSTRTKVEDVPPAHIAVTIDAIPAVDAPLLVEGVDASNPSITKIVTTNTTTANAAETDPLPVTAPRSTPAAPQPTPVASRAATTTAPAPTPASTPRTITVITPCSCNRPSDFVPSVCLMIFGAAITYNNENLSGVPLFLVGLHFLTKICSGSTLRQLNKEGYMTTIFSWLVLVFFFYGMTQEAALDNGKLADTSPNLADDSSCLSANLTSTSTSS